MNAPLTQFSEVAREWRHDNIRPQIAARVTPPEPADEFTQRMRRNRILEELGPVPAEALAAFVALDFGDDAEAYERLARVVGHVREAARLFNAMRAADASRTPAVERRAP